MRHLIWLRCLEVFCLTSKDLWILQVSSVLVSSVTLMWTEIISILKNLLRCIYSPECALSLWMSYKASEVCVFYCCWLEYFTDANWSKLTDNNNAVGVYMLPDFLPAWSTNRWQWGVEISNYTSGFVYFFFQSTVFAPTYFDDVLLVQTARIIMSSCKIDPLLLQCLSLSLIIFLFLK